MARVSERDYVLGTHDEEIERLGLQSRVWRPRVLDAWQRAEFTSGQTLLDLGCGPGWASLDLAEVVGPRGRVLAVDRSRRFLDALEALCRARSLPQVTVEERDLDEDALPWSEADGAWSRWFIAFVKRPRDLVSRVAGVLKPGGRWVLHEYLDYSTWQFIPACPEFEEFVNVVMSSWRASGGEPDIGLDLPGWLEEEGFRILSLRPLIEVVSPSSPWWLWPRAFVDVGLKRLVDLGDMSEERAAVVWSTFEARERSPGARMLTPAVIEIIAERR